MATRWLKRDAVNRAWRTVLQGLLVILVFPALDAALQVVQRAFVDSMTGQPFDWGQVRVTAMYAAGTAAMMAGAAYLHRLKVDPSPIPSAQPPLPPGLPAGAAPAMAAEPPAGRTVPTEARWTNG